VSETKLTIPPPQPIRQQIRLSEMLAILLVASAYAACVSPVLRQWDGSHWTRFGAAMLAAVPGFIVMAVYIHWMNQRFLSQPRREQLEVQAGEIAFQLPLKELGLLFKRPVPKKMALLVIVLMGLSLVISLATATSNSWLFLCSMGFCLGVNTYTATLAFAKPGKRSLPTAAW
jgi:hypothetical protein